MFYRVVLLGIILCTSIGLFGQTPLPVSRTIWNAGAPAGWTDSGTGSYTTTFACSGSNGGQLNSTGDYYQVYFSGTPDVLTYTIKVSGATTSSLLVEESAGGAAFTTVNNHTALPTSCSTYNFNLLATTQYVRWTYTKVSQNLTIDDVNITEIVSCTPASEPTLNSSIILFPNTTCSSIDLNWTSGNGSKRIIVASTSPIVGTPTDQTNYSANTNFGSGSTISANEFVIYNGSGNSTTVNGLSASTTYYFAIFEYNGTTLNCTENYYTTSVLTGSFSTPACPISACAEITGILVDACGGAIEGINEFFTFTNGTTNLSIDSLSVTFPSGGSFCNSGCGTQVWTTNPTFVNSLNITAGCAGLFVETDPIPANANIIVFTGSSPTFSFDFSGLCGTGPYYAIFADNTNTGGRFANYNATCANRTLTVEFGTTCTDNAIYDRCLLPNADGAYVAFDASGNATYANDGCTPIATLPIELLSFTGKSIGSSNLLEWETTTEINNDYFTLERSSNATHFSELGTIKGAGNSNTLLHYQYTDNAPLEGINYYRLKQTDFDGAYSYSSIVALANSPTKFTIWNSSNTLFVKSDKENLSSSLKIYNLLGELIFEKVFEELTSIETSTFSSGIYLVKVQTAKAVYTQKVKF
ncbi:MAG: hypothetical protein KFKLKKLM_00595 [Flavobacteriales bacterium]|nr:hypothetical protein [Flavobacteriales bacterium]